MITNEEIKFLARELANNGDSEAVNIALAATDIDEAWDYLLKLAKSDKEVVQQIVAKNRTVSKAIKANAARYKVVYKHVQTDINEDYDAIYQTELGALEDYCYQCLGDMLEEMYPDEWAKMLIENEAEIEKKKKIRADYEKNNAVKLADARAKAAQKRLDIAKARYLEAVEANRIARGTAAKTRAENTKQAKEVDEAAAK